MSWQWGLVIVIGIPLAVFLVVIFWPQRIPKGRSVHEIRQRIEGEDHEP
ncbi:hypothetical protein [Nocardia sp. NPDC051570]